MDKRASWSGTLAFVLAAAASAIGLGNLWRFPYLAAQYGGGMFIAVYLVLVVTLGFTLMVTEIAVGRKTQQAPLTAYSLIQKKWGFIGFLGTLIPLLIVPYYCVVGGWVLYYLKAYAVMAFTGANVMGEAAANSGDVFGAFITAPFAPFGYAMLFILACAGVIILGVKNGIEKSNLVMMPILFLMAIGISAYVVCMPGSVDGIKYYLVPNLDCVSVDGKFSIMMLAKTILGAAGQMFYSLSLAMGIMITYGSYMKKTDSIEKCVRRIELFDTLIALIAGLMIIPVVYMFAIKTGTPVKEAMSQGAGLMFITLPKVFAMFGAAGTWIGFAFFLLVTFAAATSAISLYEACVSSLCDFLKLERKTATIFMGSTIMFLASFSALGYGAWGHIKPFGLDSFLDFFDFFTNSVLMPVVAIATCIFIGWFAGPKYIIDECEADGQTFKAKAVYSFMIKYLAPALMIALLASEICRALEIGGWKI
ncbi:MAG: sodium-dependent transporter [Kiritimatiellae bacterium]|nr:sodium-dependent transporter [Kiritimatiellia bacterium]